MVAVRTFTGDEWDAVLVDPARLSLIIAEFYGAEEYQQLGNGWVAVFGKDGELKGYFETQGNPEFVQGPDYSVTLKLRELVPALRG